MIFRFTESLSKSSESLNIIDLRSLMNDMKISPYVDSIHYTNDGAEKIADFLTEDHFMDLNNKNIFKTIKRLLDKNILVLSAENFRSRIW